MTPSRASFLAQGNRAVRDGEYARAIRHYLAGAQSLDGLSELYPHLEANLSLARGRYLRQRAEARRRGEPARVGVCGWELGHNSAGRVKTLADLYQPHAVVEMIGCIFPTRAGGRPWAPLRGMSVPCHSFVVEKESLFVHQALELVAQHPYDLVHLSKPRLPNLILGWLYKWVWGAKVIMDIDDEELAFVKASDALSPHAYIAEHGELPPLENFKGQLWTRLSVGMAKCFDGVTVSNPALQRRYGGRVIPHVREEQRFKPSPSLKAASRSRFGIPQDVKVVLFYGTPREHKGVLATAEALAELGRDDVWYVVAGDFPQPALKARLQAIGGVHCHFIGNQPYDAIAEVVAVGDVCVLLQDGGALVSEFQVPAKLTDALAMGLTVLAQETPALRDMAERQAFIPVTRDNLTAKLRDVLESGRLEERTSHNRQLFIEHLSVGALSGVARGLLERSRPGVMAYDRSHRLGPLIEQGRVPGLHDPWCYEPTSAKALATTNVGT